MKLMLKWGLLAAVLTVFVGSSPALALPSGAFGGPSKCLAGKAKCVIKMKSCMLGCYKKAVAKDPFTLDPACTEKCRGKFDGGVDAAKGCFAKLEAKNDGCGASLGDTATFLAKIEAHVLDVVAELDPFGANATTGKCTAGKVGCITKFNACILGLVSKAVGGGIPIDGAKLTKCRDGLAACISKLDVKGNADENEFTGTLPGGVEGCQTAGDADALQDKDEAFVDDVIAELVTGPNDMNNQRCTNDTSIKCTDDTPCLGGGGTCEFYFGTHLPLAAGGVATCVRNQWAGGITGTFNQQTGQSAGTAGVIATVFNGISIPNPCPRCVGDPFINDGTAGGTCSGGTRNALACDGNGQSPEPSFGVTSLDCPPSGSPIANIPVDLTNTTSTVTKTLAATGPNCAGSVGDECMCGTCSGDPARPCFDTATGCTPFGAGTCVGTTGEPQKPNACVDDTTDPGGPIDGSLCASVGGGEGACLEGPLVQRCKLETFRSCTVATQAVDCPTAGDSCATVSRECFPGYNGVVGDTIASTGSATAPRNHAGVQEFASVFCISPTSAPAVNAAAGLPGPGRLALGGVGQENGTAACPTEASFLPTFRGGVLDTGWTGIAHDAKALSGGKVTVAVSGCSGAHPNCGVCTYAGPIANANANP